MAAVSALPNGRGLRTGGNVPQEPHTWDYAGRNSQDVSNLRCLGKDILRELAATAPA